MKIITLSSKDIFGGAAKVAYRLHRSLLKNGVDDLFLVNTKRVNNDSTVVRAANFYSKQGRIYNFIDKFRLRYNENCRINKWKPYRLTSKSTLMMDLEVTLLRDALNNLQFDLIQLHWVGESYVNFTEFSNIKCPVVWTLHDCFAFTGVCTHFEECEKFQIHCGACPHLGSNKEKDLSFKVFEQKLERYKNIDFHIVCPSKWLAENVRKSKLLGKYPIQVIPNGIDTDFFYPILKESAKTSLGIDPNKKVILFGGVSVNKDTRKGGHLLLKALSNLKYKYEKEDIQLVIFGVDSLDMDLNYETTYLGYIDNEKFMRILYSAADVVVVPSMYENLPTVIMESLSCGSPVAAFNIGGNSDMIDHLVNGYLANPYDTEDLAQGITYCLENNDQNKLGIEARKKVLDNFRIEDITRRYIDLYKSLVVTKDNH